MGLRGNVGALKSIGQTIRKLPTSVAHDVAQRAAPVLTTLTRADFDAGRNVYGDARPRSVVTGKPLTLDRTGATKADLRFVSNGTIIRCVLGTKWAKYLIGKYGILPSGALPVEYKAALDNVVAQTKAPGAL